MCRYSRAQFQLAARLSPWQQLWGGLLLYEDPHDPKNAYRQPFRRALLANALANRQFGYRLGKLSDAAWRRLNEGGLRWGDTHLPRSEEQDLMRNLRDDGEKDEILRLREPRDPEAVHKALILEVSGSGNIYQKSFLPLTLEVAPNPTAYPLPQPLAPGR